jgi:hypothetical protein
MADYVAVVDRYSRRHCADSGIPAAPQNGGRSQSAGRHPMQSARTQLREFFRARSTLLALLLAVIVLSLLSSTMLAQQDQIFLPKVFLVLFLSLLPVCLYLHFTVSKGRGSHD